MPFILQTKLQKPQLSNQLVLRHRLIERLNSASRKKLMLVVAPAGYGKSTLISQWLDEIPNSTWFSIDDNDNDPIRFFSYFLNSINNFKSNLADTSLQILQSQKQNPPLEYVLGELINKLSVFPEQLLIVVDDYHLIKEKAIHDLLFFFISNIPANVHVVIGTRSDPPFLIARLRGQAQVEELRVKDLCFDDTETTLFLQQTMKLELGEEEIRKLDSRVEGWVAGLQMAGITLQGAKDKYEFINSLSASNQFILDYLSEEIYHQQSEEIKSFLLKTSILKRFTSSVCNEMNGIDNSESILEYLRRSNLFIISLDQERTWYRFHHLFADLLLQRLIKSKQHSLKELRVAAGKWFEKENLTIEAIEYYLDAGQFSLADKLLDQTAERFWVNGEQLIIKEWTKSFPENFHFSPRLSVVLAAINILDGNYLEAEHIAESALSRQKDKDSNQQLKGIVAAVKSYIANYRADIESTEHYASEALALLGKENALWKCLASLAMGDMHVQRGDHLQLAVDSYRNAVEEGDFIGNNYCKTLGQHRLTVIFQRMGKHRLAWKTVNQYTEKSIPGVSKSGALYLIKGELLYEYNKLGEANQCFETALNLCKKQMHVAALPYCKMFQAKTYYAQRNTEKAIQLIEESITILEKTDMPPWVTSFVRSWKAFLDIKTGHQELAEKYFNDRNLALEGEFNYPNLTDYVIYGLYLTETRNHDDAVRLLTRLENYLSNVAWMELALRSRILLAYNLHQTNHSDKVLKILIGVLDFAEPEEYQRTFLDLWDFCKDLLITIKEEGNHVEYINALNLQASATNKEKETYPDWFIEPLSDRELEVLKLFQLQLTNSEIADKLFISVNTVKTHIKNIYFKLDTNNKRQAIEKAAEIGIL